ncbi:hypothetical protein [Helicobacter pylori]|uniref:hypothetical protein n=1 Tax=Helicobacter pylori TaxID=210 RepID=UPI00192255BC|nr:hypothetical protein [Helicobacter pylori]QQW67502.1 hypothetical protein HGK50_03150 [Helicobacter pylori]QQW95044.1 hypothetical protein HG559_03255 [Helicobacter pylori]QQW97927.1 hypothetical protein HG557_03235 [Helicobacter pylori]
MVVRFGVIFITDDETKELRSILERKSDLGFIWFVESSVYVHKTPKVFEEESVFVAELGFKTNQITAFMVFTSESDTIFNLKNYLLVLAKNFNGGDTELVKKFNSRDDIWYCENAICDKNGTYNIELVNNTNDFRGVFGEVLSTVKDTSNGDLLQLLTNLKNKEIEIDFHKKINYGLPFGIIFIAGNSDNPIDIDNKTEKLKSCFYNDKNNIFIDYPILIEDYLILDNLKSCFVLQNKPNVTLFDNDENYRPFNLKQYLLGLKEKLGFELTGIFYCENANTHKIELIGNDSDFREVLLEFSENIPKAPNEIPQFLTNFKNSKSPNEKISFSPPKNYPSKNYPSNFLYKVRNTFDRYLWHGYSKIPQEKRIAKIKEQVEEEIKLDPSFRNHRASSEQNRKINEIAEGLKSGKIIGKKIISNAFDLNASYCFITPDGLKNLKERLFIDIINAINQKKRVALDHAQIDDIQYNVLDSAFYFIFDVGNSSQLAIKVPRKSLENDELPNTKKNIFNGLIRTICGCIDDDENSFLLENDKTINNLKLQDLLGKLKTQAFPLSDIITNTINKKEEVAALDYALINDIKYNLLDNTFHFIFDIGNPLLKESSQLVIEVPREALDLENVDRLVEYMLSPYNNHSQGSLVYHISEGSYIIDLHLIDD